MEELTPSRVQVAVVIELEAVDDRKRGLRSLGLRESDCSFATVMFSDIRDFTPLVESQTPDETIELLGKSEPVDVYAVG